MKYWILDKEILILKIKDPHKGISALAKSKNESHLYITIEIPSEFYAYGTSKNLKTIGHIKALGNGYYSLRINKKIDNIEIFLFDEKGKVLKHLNIKL